METRPLGPGGPPIPVLGQGTWRMELDDRASCLAALRRGLDLGLTHLDTAEMYGSGRVEEIVAEAVAGRRDEVFLALKILPGNASREGTIAACERSLRRLRTDRLDLYLLHWPGTHPLWETFEAFERLREQGKIRAWGVSNFDVEEIEDASRIAGPGGIACNQVLYHLGDRGIEHRLAGACATRRIALVGYSPFGSGAFPRPRAADGRILAEIAALRGATPRQVALAFLLRKVPVHLIPKAARPAHVEENARAAGIELASQEMARIDRAFPLGRVPRPLGVI